MLCSGTAWAKVGSEQRPEGARCRNTLQLQLLQAQLAEARVVCTSVQGELPQPLHRRVPHNHALKARSGRMIFYKCSFMQTKEK